MFCKNCGNTVRDGAAFCPNCGTKIEAPGGNAETASGAENGRHPVPADNPVYGTVPVCGMSGYGEMFRGQQVSSQLIKESRPDPVDLSALRYFFTPVAISLIGVLMNLLNQRFINLYGVLVTAGTAAYSNALNVLQILCNVFLCSFAFIISRSGREKRGAQILWILSIILTIAPALCAPWMLTLYVQDPKIAAVIPRIAMMLSLAAAAGLGILLGSLLKPGRVWIYAVTAAGVLILSCVLGIIFWRSGIQSNAKLIVCSFKGLYYFAFYAFPAVGLSAAWAGNPAAASVVSVFPSGQKSIQEIRDFSEIPPELQPEAPSPGMTVLGFFVPLAGFIVWLAMHGTSPGKSRSAGQGAAAGAAFFGTLFLSYILLLSHL